MGGRFQNTEYVNTVNGMTDSMLSLLNNPYYIHNDKKPYITDYLNVNKELTTLDDGAKSVYSNYGENCPIKYNLIKNFVMYGSGNRIEPTLSREDFGLVGDGIEGEFVLLPNTITPYPGDLFRISMINSSCALFKVNTVNVDTLPNGQNFYKITYKLESIEESRFKELKAFIVNTYHMIIDNIGTDYNIIIRDDTYNFINKLDDLSVRLKLYFKSLFYNTSVQTFIYKYINDTPIYDFFMIEFLMRNRILDNDGNYIYICHQMRIPSTFTIEYNRSFFRCIELKDIKRIRMYNYRAHPIYINDIRSIFQTRMEDYYYACYACTDVAKSVIPSFNDDLIYNIENNIKYTESKYRIFNIIIKYFNNEDITMDDIEAFDYIGYDSTIELFYGIPCMIYCLDKYINNMINNHYKDKQDTPSNTF